MSAISGLHGEPLSPKSAAAQKEAEKQQEIDSSQKKHTEHQEPMSSSRSPNANPTRERSSCQCRCGCRNKFALDERVPCPYCVRLICPRGCNCWRATLCHFCWAYPGEQAERAVGKEDAPVPAEHEVEEFAPVQEHDKLELSWFAVSWGRMANEFFLRESNAHRCMMFNLSLGSASAMRRLRQEAGDLEEAPLPEQVVGDEEVAEQPEHEVDGDVGASPRTLRKRVHSAAARKEARRAGCGDEEVRKAASAAS